MNPSDSTDGLRQAIARAFCAVGGWTTPIDDAKLSDIDVALSRCSAFRDASDLERQIILANAHAVIQSDGLEGVGSVREEIGSMHGQEMLEVMIALVLSWDPDADRKKQLMWHLNTDVGMSMGDYYQMWDRVRFSPPLTFATPGGGAPKPASSPSTRPRTKTEPILLPTADQPARPQAPPLPATSSSGRLQNEVRLLNQYAEEIERLKRQLAEAEPGSVKHVQRQIEQKMQIFSKQINLVKTEFPKASEGFLAEALFYYFQAAILILSKGAMRRFAQGGAPLAMRLAAGAIAKMQESGEPARALELLQKSIRICDTPAARFFRAHIYLDQGHKEQAITELNYIISRFPDDDLYVEARGLKDEIENPPKKGCLGCFVATAAYGSPLAKEVILLSRFRDDVLLRSWLGSKFVAFYYRVSPPLAAVIARYDFLRAATRRLLLAPVLHLLKSSQFNA